MVLSFPKYFPVLRYLIPTLIYKCDNGLVSASHDLPLTVPTHGVYCIVIEHHWDGYFKSHKLMIAFPISSYSKLLVKDISPFSGRSLFMKTIDLAINNSMKL